MLKSWRNLLFCVSYNSVRIYNSLQMCWWKNRQIMSHPCQYLNNESSYLGTDRAEHINMVQIFMLSIPIRITYLPGNSKLKVNICLNISFRDGNKVYMSVKCLKEKDFISIARLSSCHLAILVSDEPKF